MVVDVSMGMVNRAKASVVKKVMDSLTDEYSRFYDYALEPKRSNPRSSVHVVLDPEEVDRVFKEFTPACWSACVSGSSTGTVCFLIHKAGTGLAQLPPLDQRMDLVLSFALYFRQPAIYGALPSPARIRNDKINFDFFLVVV